MNKQDRNFVIFLIVIFLTVLGIIKAQAQAGVTFSGAIDIRNATFGSEATGNNPELNGLFKFGMIGNEGIEVDIIYQTFPNIDFSSFSFGVGYNVPISKNIDLVPMLEPLVLINRTWEDGEKSSHLSTAADLSLRYKIADNWQIELLSNLLYRTDLKAKYDDDKFIFSNFVGIIYKIEL